MQKYKGAQICNAWWEGAGDSKIVQRLNNAKLIFGREQPVLRGFCLCMDSFKRIFR